jgi:hypothetical protein
MPVPLISALGEVNSSSSQAPQPNNRRFSDAEDCCLNPFLRHVLSVDRASASLWSPRALTRATSKQMAFRSA